MTGVQQMLRLAMGFYAVPWPHVGRTPTILRFSFDSDAESDLMTSIRAPQGVPAPVPHGIYYEVAFRLAHVPEPSTGNDGVTSQVGLSACERREAAKIRDCYFCERILHSRRPESPEQCRLLVRAGMRVVA